MRCGRRCPVASHRPSGLKATALTGPWCPHNPRPPRFCTESRRLCSAEMTVSKLLSLYIFTDSEASRTLFWGSLSRTAADWAARLAERLRWAFSSVCLRIGCTTFGLFLIGLCKGCVAVSQTLILLCFGCLRNRDTLLPPRHPSQGSRQDRCYKSGDGEPNKKPLSPDLRLPLLFLLPDTGLDELPLRVIEVLSPFGEPTLGLGQETSCEVGSSGPGSATRPRTVPAASARSGSRGHR